jgi:hypothetical protein
VVSRVEMADAAPQAEPGRDRGGRKNHVQDGVTKEECWEPLRRIEVNRG